MMNWLKIAFVVLLIDEGLLALFLSSPSRIFDMTMTVRVKFFLNAKLKFFNALNTKLWYHKEVLKKI